MQRPGFSLSRSALSRPTPSHRTRLRREPLRWWALLCVLPMLVMGTLANAPHAHELRAFTGVLQAGQHAGQHEHASQAQTPNARLASVPRLNSDHADECQLCQWASAAGACLVGALLWSWPLLGATLGAFDLSFSAFAVPLSLRSRAPPI